MATLGLIAKGQLSPLVVLGTIIQGIHMVKDPQDLENHMGNLVFKIAWEDHHRGHQAVIVLTSGVITSRWPLRYRKTHSVTILSLKM